METTEEHSIWTCSTWLMLNLFSYIAQVISRHVTGQSDGGNSPVVRILLSKYGKLITRISPDTLNETLIAEIMLDWVVYE